MARQAGDGRRVHPPRRGDAEAHPALVSRRVCRQGPGPVRPVLPDGRGRRARDRADPPRPLCAPAADVAVVLHEPPLGRADVPRRDRREPPGAPVVDGAGDDDPPVRDGHRADHRHVRARLAARPDRPGRLPVRRRGGALDRPPPLPHQQALAAEDRRAERAASRGVLGHEDRQGVRTGGARGRAIRPRQPRAPLPGAQGPSHRRDHGPAHGGAGRLRHHGSPLVRRPASHQRRDDPGRFLLVHGGGRAPLRTGSTALADRQHRAAVDLVRRAGLRDPRPAAGDRRPGERRGARLVP